MSISKRFWWKYSGIFLFLGVWELISQLQLVNPFFIPPVSTVIATAWDLTISGTLPVHTLFSLERSLVGFILAVIIAVPLGLILGSWFKYLKLVFNPLLEFWSQINPFILLHLILFFLKLGEVVQITMITWACIWPILFNTISGVQNINPQIIKAARAFGINRRALVWKVLVPAAAPTMFSGIRLSAGYSFFVIIAAEMMGSRSGLGWLILNNQENYQVTRIYAAAVIIALLGLGIDLVMQYIEKKVIVYEK